MSVYAIYQDIREHRFETIMLIVALLKLIDIAPIKISPWSAITKWFQKVINGNVTEKLDKLEQKLDKHIEESDERDLRKRRESILDFASAIASGRNYSKEQYEQMLRECDEYTMYCHEKQFINSVADESIAVIKNSYSTRLNENSFLQGYIIPKGG